MRPDGFRLKKIALGPQVIYYFNPEGRHRAKYQREFEPKTDLRATGTGFSSSFPLAANSQAEHTYFHFIRWEERGSPALNRHCGKGQQKVTVEHVHVHAGGQAVVGLVETPGGGDQAKSEDQPHAKQITDASQPAMWGENAKRQTMPVTSDAERSVPDTRRKIAGRSEG